MDIDEDDDFYAPSEDVPTVNQAEKVRPHPEVNPEEHNEDLEEGEEEDEEGEDDGSDSDIDIITERKDGTKAAPPSQARYNEIRNIPQRTASSDVTVKPTVKKDPSSKGSVPVSVVDLPPIATSKVDIDAKPIYEPAAKPITQVSIDEDLPENDKPWRRPGTDITDYFNYGFDEFTWALYAAKQEALRSEYDQDKIAQNNKKMFEDMNMMMALGGMPGMPGLPAAGSAPGASMALPPMPGMEGIPPEMQAMMQQMMASGIDPSQMDPAAMFASMAGGQGGGTSQGSGQSSNQGAGFGGQQSFGQGQNQQSMGYGYDMNNSNRGNFRGRGRGHRNW